MATNELLTPEEVDSFLRYPRGRSTRLAKAGLLPAVILPDGELRFVREAIRGAIAKLPSPTTPPKNMAADRQDLHAVGAGQEGRT